MSVDADMSIADARQSAWDFARSVAAKTGAGSEAIFLVDLCEAISFAYTLPVEVRAVVFHCWREQARVQAELYRAKTFAEEKIRKIRIICDGGG